MQAKITRSFRITEGEATRKYTPGQIAEGDTAKWAIENGHGEELKEEKANQKPSNKAASKPANKGA